MKIRKISIPVWLYLYFVGKLPLAITAFVSGIHLMLSNGKFNVDVNCWNCLVSYLPQVCVFRWL